MFEIGSSLREARIRNGYDLAEAEAATKIRSKYLGALEEERFDVLPAPMYVKGFLRSYAEFLGLDGQLYVDEFNTRHGSDEEEYVVPRRPQKRRPSREHHRFESRVLVLALVGIVAAALLVVAAWRWGGAEAGSVANLESRNPETIGSSPPAVQPVKRPPVTLVVRAARGNSQLQVLRGSASGHILFAGTLEQGRMRRFTGKRLWLNVASPENLDARLNGKAVRLSTERRPISVVVTRKGVAPAPS